MSELHPPWLLDPAVRRLLGALAAGGVEARFVGGCVRDALLGIAGGDIDLATPARPEAVIAALETAKVKAVPTGLDHGTVTAVVDTQAKPRHFEITTLRRDVATDGRHAVVAFGADWDEDAARRDFTINAIYLSPDGTLYDPVGGRADLAARRVRFVGDAATRIAEDVLRVLRYYRFEARFGRAAGDPSARAACRAAAAKLPSLSAERAWRELRGLLSLDDPIRALRMMNEDGVLVTIIPEATRLDRFAAIARPFGGSERESPNIPLRLAALIDVDRAGALAVAERLRLPGDDRNRLAELAKPWPLTPRARDKAQRLAVYRLGRERYCDLALLLLAEGRLGRKRFVKLTTLAQTWTIPAFPIGGGDVTALGIAPGPRVGRLLAAVRRWWEERDFAADRAACLARLKQIARRP